jgi:hypothetical protein
MLGVAQKRPLSLNLINQLKAEVAIHPDIFFSFLHIGCSTTIHVQEGDYQSISDRETVRETTEKD